MKILTVLEQGVNKNNLIFKYQISLITFKLNYPIFAFQEKMIKIAMAKDQLHVIEDGKEMGFLDHLEELRWHLLRSALAVIIFSIIIFLNKAFTFQTVVLGPKNPHFVTYDFLCNLSEMLCFRPKDFTLKTIDIGEQFFMHMKVSIMLGLVVAFPYIFWEIWRFVKPGLLPIERKAAKGFVFICSTLFFLGVLFGYFVMAPFSISFLSSYSVGMDVETAPTLSSYIGYLVMVTLPTGIVFELPVVVYFLSKIGLVTPKVMRKYRKHAIVLILIVAAIITPPDVITQLLIGFPLFLLYEVSIYISARVEKKEKALELLEK